MKYIITGGCGFIGSNLIEYINSVDKDSEIIIVDNMITGALENVEKLKYKKIYECDVKDVDTYKHELLDCDVIYHLAASASVELSINDTMFTFNNNLGTTVALFDLVRKVNSNIKVIQASSAAVYGNVETNQGLLEDSVLEPMSPYAVDKLSCENYAQLYNNLFEMNITTVRPFNVYGKNQKLDSSYSGVITIFSHLLNDNKTLKVYGDGESTRDYIYIKDFVRALYILIDGEKTIYNIGSNSSTSVNSVIKTLFKVFNNEVKIDYCPPRAGDIKHSLANADRLNSLGFECEFDLYKGVIDYHKEQFN